MERNMEDSQKPDLEPPYNSATLLLGIQPKKMKSEFWRNICTLMSIAALFTIDNIEEYYSAMRKKEILPFVTT